MAEGKLENSLESDLFETFQKCTEHLQTKIDGLESKKLLYFYARFKQANIGPCNIPKPMFYDFQGKEKWYSWKELGEMSKEEAMKEYIEEMKIVDPEFNPSSNAITRNQFGPVVSTMVKLDKELQHNEKTVFDFVKENLLEDLKKCPLDYNLKDENGLALLHWACDRGHSNIVNYLLANNADVNIQDENKQTPLHYASSCGHGEIIETLLKNNANINIKDDQQLLPMDVALNNYIIEILKYNK